MWTIVDDCGESLDSGGIRPVTQEINWGGLCSAVTERSAAALRFAGSIPARNKYLYMT